MITATIPAEAIPTDRRVYRARGHGAAGIGDYNRHYAKYVSEPLWLNNFDEAFEKLRESLANFSIDLTKESFNAEIKRVLNSKNLDAFCKVGRAGSGYKLERLGKTRLYTFLCPLFEYDEEL